MLVGFFFDQHSCWSVFFWTNARLGPPADSDPQRLRYSQWRNRSLTHSLTHSFIHSLTHSFTFSLTRSLSHSLTELLHRWKEWFANHFAKCSTRSTATDRQPQTGSHRQAATDTQPWTGSHRQTTTDRRPQTGSHRQTAAEAI